MKIFQNYRLNQVFIDYKYLKIINFTLFNEINFFLNIEDVKISKIINIKMLMK